MLIVLSSHFMENGIERQIYVGAKIFDVPVYMRRLQKFMDKICPSFKMFKMSRYSFEMSGVLSHLH